MALDIAIILNDQCSAASAQIKTLVAENVWLHYHTVDNFAITDNGRRCSFAMPRRNALIDALLDILSNFKPDISHFSIIDNVSEQQIMVDFNEDLNKYVRHA